MATGTPSLSGSVLSRAYDVIEAALAASTNKTPWVYELLPDGGARFGHTLYGVGLLGSSPQRADDKQKAAHFLNSRSRIGVRLQYRLTEGDQVTQYAAGASIADIIIATLITGADASAGGQGPQKWHWIETRPPRIVGDGTFVLHEIHFWVDHVNSLSL